MALHGFDDGGGGIRLNEMEYMPEVIIPPKDMFIYRICSGWPEYHNLKQYQRQLLTGPFAFKHTLLLPVNVTAIEVAKTIAPISDLRGLQLSIRRNRDLRASARQISFSAGPSRIKPFLEALFKALVIWG